MGLQAGQTGPAANPVLFFILRWLCHTANIHGSYENRSDQISIWLWLLCPGFVLSFSDLVVVMLDLPNHQIVCKGYTVSSAIMQICPLGYWKFSRLILKISWLVTHLLFLCFIKLRTWSRWTLNWWVGRINCRKLHVGWCGFWSKIQAQGWNNVEWHWYEALRRMKSTIAGLKIEVKSIVIRRTVGIQRHLVGKDLRRQLKEVALSRSLSIGLTQLVAQFYWWSEMHRSRPAAGTKLRITRVTLVRLGRGRLRT